MIAIRGATTVNADSADEIKLAVGQLLAEIESKNRLNKNEVVCIMLSNTSDISSYYPAKAAREAGFFDCPLYSSLEPDIEGSLSKCIRVMLLVEKEGKPVHVYLNKATNLRKDLTAKLNIALDGPAGSGKSTVAKLLAKRLDILYLDTGAMYRACALACLTNNIDCKNSTLVKELINKIDISVKDAGGSQITLLDGVDVSERIRTPEISMIASTVSAYAFVREKMVDLQRRIARENPCVLDGRDIGTNVLPNTEFKYFITATPEIRATRRLAENREKGYSQSFDEVLDEIVKRDKQDATREVNPLVKADDAKEIITDNFSAEEVAEIILKDIQGKV